MKASSPPLASSTRLFQSVGLTAYFNIPPQVVVNQPWKATVSIVDEGQQEHDNLIFVISLSGDGLRFVDNWWHTLHFDAAQHRGEVTFEVAVEIAGEFKIVAEVYWERHWLNDLSLRGQATATLLDTRVDRLRDDSPEAQPILAEIEEISARGRQRFNACRDALKYAHAPTALDWLTEDERNRLHDLQLMLRPKSQAEAQADVAAKRAARLTH